MTEDEIDAVERLAETSGDVPTLRAAVHALAGEVRRRIEAMRKGGQVSSRRKTAAVRANAKKGGWPKGRPRKVKP